MKLRAVGEVDKRIRIVEDETKRFFEAYETNSWPAPRYSSAYGEEGNKWAFAFVSFASASSASSV